MEGQLYLHVAHKDTEPTEETSVPQPRDWMLILIHSQSHGGTFYRIESSQLGDYNGAPVYSYRTLVEYNIEVTDKSRSQSHECVAILPVTSWSAIDANIRSVEPQKSADYVATVLQKLEDAGHAAKGSLTERYRRKLDPSAPRPAKTVRFSENT